jgi:hypothetical protein
MWLALFLFIVTALHGLLEDALDSTERGIDWHE